MNLLRHISYFLLVILIISSCGNDEKQGIPKSDTMDFNNLEIGNQFLYSFLRGDSYHDDSNFDFEYTGDTLKLEVIEKIGDKFLIEESLLPNSAVYNDSIKYLKADSTYSNLWFVENDTLIIEAYQSGLIEGHFFDTPYNGSVRRFSLSDFNEDEVEMEGWKTEMSYVGGSLDAFTTDFDLFGHNYNRLNVMIRNIAMAADGNGWTYLYNKDVGFIRVITYSAWTGKGRGWDKI